MDDTNNMCSDEEETIIMKSNKVRNHQKVKKSE
jgi:hypothetical protein